MVGEGGAVGPVVVWGTVPLTHDGGTFPGTRKGLLLGFAKPVPVGLKPQEDPEPKGSV